MRRALSLAERGYGRTSPNPMVGAVIVRNGRIIGEGWHQRAGEPHAEVNAIAAARRANHNLQGATLFVTLEPCSTFGRTPPCSAAIAASGIREVIAAAHDLNPKHSGRGFRLLRATGLRVRSGLLQANAALLNEGFNHWITRKTPFIACKCAMSLDGKIATNSGDSQWITSEKARSMAMRLRLGADAIAVGVNTILRDDPALTLRPSPGLRIPSWKKLKRIVFDPEGRIPASARILNDESAALTTVVVTKRATKKKIATLERQVRVTIAPTISASRQINLRWLMRELGREEITSLLVEGGGETHFNFLQQALVHRVYFFYAPLLITGRAAPKAVGGDHSLQRGQGICLTQVEWSKVGRDLLCRALVQRRRQK